MDSWTVSLDGATVLIDTAQVGRAENREARPFSTRLRALWEIDRLCQKRAVEGFELVERDDNRRPLARGDFEAALRSDPDGEDNYLVHADWLQSRGDPTGQLIAVQHALRHAARGSARQAELERRETALLFEHRRHLWGPLGERVIDPHLQLYATELLAPTWHLGFLRSVELQLFDMEIPPELDATALVRTLFDLHIAKLLRGIGVRAHCSRDWPGLLELPELIAEFAPPTLRWLQFGHHDHWNQIPLVRIGERVPPLATLSLCARQVELPETLPASLTNALEELSVSTYRTSNDLLKTIARPRWPKLRSLSLRHHHLTARADRVHFSTQPLRAILSGAHAPALHALTLHGTTDTDELCHMLSDSPLADSLTYLDISFGHLSADGVDILARRRLPGLRTLIAIETPISATDAQRLRYAAPTVEVHPLREEWNEP